MKAYVPSSLSAYEEACEGQVLGETPIFLDRPSKVVDMGLHTVALKSWNVRFAAAAGRIAAGKKALRTQPQGRKVAMAHCGQLELQCWS